MSFYSDVLVFLMVLPLGVWLGAMVFFSFIGAPKLFSVLDKEQAGAAVTAIFPQYYTFGAGLGVGGFVAGLIYGIVRGFGFRLGLVFLFILLAVAATGYARWGLIPRMDEAANEAFERYHRLSVILNGFTMVIVAFAILGTQFL